MNRFDNEIRNSISKEDIPMPENFTAAVDETLNNLPVRFSTKRRSFLPRLASAAAALVFVFFMALPNVSPAYAKVMSEVPVIGALVEVFTLRSYSEAGETYELEASVPVVQDAANAEAADLLRGGYSKGSLGGCGKSVNLEADLKGHRITQICCEGRIASEYHHVSIKAVDVERVLADARIVDYLRIADNGGQKSVLCRIRGGEAREVKIN